MTTYRVLQVGAGGWGRVWARNITECERTELVAWVDVRPGAAAEAAKMVGLEDVYVSTNLKEAAAATRPDFVVNVSFPSAHRDVTIEALELGLPVLCEKPMADTMDKAREMVEASERTGQLLVISQQRRYDAGLVAARRLIEKHVGPLGILNADFYHGHPQAAFLSQMASPLLLDMAIHTFDVARYLSGADPVAVYCEDFNPSWSWFKGNASAVAMFEMTGGLRYTYRGSWCSQGKDTTWESDWRAVGPHGTVVWDGGSSPVAEVVDEIGVFPVQTKRIAGRARKTMLTGLAGSLDAFLRALDTGEPPMGECHDNIKSLAMVFGAIESAQTGKRVRIEI